MYEVCIHVFIRKTFSNAPLIVLLSRSTNLYMSKVHSEFVSCVCFTGGGELYCLYAESSGTYYKVMLYNTDATVDDSTTYRFTCYVRYKYLTTAIQKVKEVNNDRA